MQKCGNIQKITIIICHIIEGFSSGIGNELRPLFSLPTTQQPVTLEIPKVEATLTMHFHLDVLLVDSFLEKGAKKII
jgi:hypothetical protein